MRKLGTVALAVIPWCFALCPASAQAPSESLRWSFSRSEGDQPLSVSGEKARLEGQFAYKTGVAGDALRFDGYTTALRIPAASLPKSSDGFTVEAWLALNTYPWSHLPIVDQEKARQTGYAFEVDAFGHLWFSASIDGQWQTAHSTEVVALKSWAHVAASYQTDHGSGRLTVFLNGKPVAETAVHGQFSPGKADVLVGRVREPEMPFPQAEIRPAEPIWFSLDGLLDELAFTAHGMSSEELAGHYSAVKAPSAPSLPYQKMPSGPAGPGRFGAYYAGLHYEESWDALRRVDDASDVVVRFDGSPTRLVFWQGLNYVPAWVSGDDKWYTDEFLEVWDKGCPDGGDCEPMSDKQERSSRVNIVESNDARVVVHWRYALAEVVGFKGAWQNPLTGWTDWADEYWTVYPDGIAVRKQVLHSDHPDAVHEWQETIVLHQPGQRPEDNIEADAITLGNMRGETKTFSWVLKKDKAFTDPTGPSGMAPLPEPNLQIVNLKSAWKPFQVVPPQGATADFYNNEKSYFTFECWNHWPVAQIASSDRPCVTTDRPSHSSLSHLFWQTYTRSENSATKILMSGLTQLSMPEILPLARSWITPPALAISDNSALTAHYDPTQRAYVIEAGENGYSAPLHLQMQASATSPAFNPAILLKGWGEKGAEVLLDGRRLVAGRSVRTGQVRSLDRTDLILWLPLQSQKPVRLTVSPVR